MKALQRIKNENQELKERIAELQKSSDTLERLKGLLTKMFELKAKQLLHKDDKALVTQLQARIFDIENELLEWLQESQTRTPA